MTRVARQQIGGAETKDWGYEVKNIVLLGHRNNVVLAGTFMRARDHEELSRRSGNLFMKWLHR